MRPDSLPILAYHSVDERGSVLATGSALFDWQMGRLRKLGYRSLPLLEAAERLRHRRPLPERAFVVTFDDGYESVYKAAAPILEKHGFRATVFLVTNRCGRQSDWPGPGGGRPLLGWAQARELQARGHEIGSHSATHPDLTALSTEQVREEILGSKRRLEQELDEGPRFFAYPYGRYDHRVRDIVRREFRGACATRLGRAGADDDPWELPRIEMHYLSRASRFDAFAAGGQRGYLWRRQMLRALRTGVGAALTGRASGQ